MKTDLVFHETFTKHVLSPDHPESPERLITAMEYIKRRGLLEQSNVSLVTPSAADLETVYAIHGRSYIDDLRGKSEHGGGIFTLDTSSNRFTYDAAVLAAGAGCMAVDRIMGGQSTNAYVLCRPPGHHAEYARAYGFCFINNIAVAAKHLLQKHGLERVLIVDYDAHHGNGTQNAFYSSNQVFYIGLHQDGRTLFPGTGFPDEVGEGDGAGYTANLAMYPGAGDQSYRIAFEEIIEPIAEAYKPDFVLVSAGFDCHFKDPLTSLGLTNSGIAMMNRNLHTIAEKVSKGRLAFFLEGGYNLDTVGQGSQILMEELSENDVFTFDDRHIENPKSVEYTKQLVSVLKEYLRPVFEL